jgi:hypothetical protein
MREIQRSKIPQAHAMAREQVVGLHRRHLWFEDQPTKAPHLAGVNATFHGRHLVVSLSPFVLVPMLFRVNIISFPFSRPIRSTVSQPLETSRYPRVHSFTRGYHSTTILTSTPS